MALNYIIAIHEPIIHPLDIPVSDSHDGFSFPRGFPSHLNRALWCYPCKPEYLPHVGVEFTVYEPEGWSTSCSSQGGSQRRAKGSPRPMVILVWS